MLSFTIYNSIKIWGNPNLMLEKWTNFQSNFKDKFWCNMWMNYSKINNLNFELLKKNTLTEKI